MGSPSWQDELRTNAPFQQEEWWSHCRKSRSTMDFISVDTPMLVFACEDHPIPMLPPVLEGTGEFAIPAYDFWVDAVACEIQDRSVSPPAARCQQVCHIGTWTMAKRLFGHGMLKRMWVAEGTKQRAQTSRDRLLRAGERNQGDLLGWKWIPVWLRTSKGKKANHCGERKSEVPHSLRKKLCPERWTFQKVKKFWRSRNVLVYI